jgi:hypothetical protein
MLTLNDRERELWILNYEDLYRWWRAEQPHRETPTLRWIALNRPDIDRIIKAELGGEPNE